MIQVPVGKPVYKQIAGLEPKQTVELKVHLHGRPTVAQFVSRNAKPITCHLKYPESRSDRKGTKSVTVRVIVEKK